MQKINEDKKVVYEKCALCGEVTDILIDLPIDKRIRYISPIGQLCRKCWIETYENDKDIKTDDMCMHRR